MSILHCINQQGCKSQIDCTDEGHCIAQHGSPAPRQPQWDRGNIIDSLRVIASRRGMAIQRGDVLAVEAAINALSLPSEIGTTDQRGSAPLAGGAGFAANTPRSTGHADSHPAASPAATPRTDREEYVTGPNDVGFRVVNPALCRTLERERNEKDRQLSECYARLDAALKSPPSATAAIDNIPEYFAKPGIVEGLAAAHPAMLVRQMANEILRLRGEAPRVEATATDSWLSDSAECGEASTGKGIFCTKPIQKNEIIALWGGRIVAAPTSIDLSLAVQVSESAFIVPRVLGDGDYVNHSCDPNAYVDGQIALKALRKIEVGEQITFDYATTDRLPYDEFKCECGAANCRGVITGNDWKIPGLLRVEETEPDRPDWARQLPGAELYDRAARYEYVRTLNLRQFAALYDEALADERFDDVVDRHRMKGDKQNG